MTKLTGLDYMTKDLLELKSHSEYSPHAKRIVDRIAKLSTEEIEKIVLPVGRKK